MKKLPFIIGFVMIIALLIILIYAVHLHIGYQATKVEVYENDVEYLTITYQKNGSIRFERENKEDHGIFSCGADFVNETKAVFDGSQALPEMFLYYEFIFKESQVELYDDGTLIGTYELKVTVSGLS